MSSWSWHISFNSQNILELTIYFQELGYQAIEQKPAYDSGSLWGEWMLFNENMNSKRIEDRRSWPRFRSFQNQFSDICDEDLPFYSRFNEFQISYIVCRALLVACRIVMQTHWNKRKFFGGQYGCWHWSYVKTLCCVLWFCVLYKL